MEQDFGANQWIEELAKLAEQCATNLRAAGITLHPVEREWGVDADANLDFMAREAAPTTLVERIDGVVFHADFSGDSVNSRHYNEHAGQPGLFESVVAAMRK